VLFSCVARDSCEGCGSRPWNCVVGRRGSGFDGGAIVITFSDIGEGNITLESDADLPNEFLFRETQQARIAEVVLLNVWHQ
jgi:hypothetical protein